jgi:hypothetical protein
MNSRRANYASFILFSSSLIGLPFRTQAAIVIQTPLSPVIETFTSQPAATEWSTTTVGNNFGAASGDIFDIQSADTMVGTVDNPFGSVDVFFAGDVLTLGATPGTVALQSQSRYYSDGFVGTTPTVVAGNLLIAHLTNQTGRTLTELQISYDLGIQNGNVDTVEEVFAGHRVYWSLTGEIESWNPIDNFGYRGVAGNPATQTEVQSLTAPLGAWPTGTEAYILWLDDNSATNPDALYTIDNVSFTGVPEPATGLLVLSAAGVFGGLRRGRTS